MVRDAKDARSGDRFWTGADVAVEVVSPDNPERDFVQSAHDYGEAAIAEYWIVGPRTESITILKLGEAEYVEDGVYGWKEQASSLELAGFSVDVGDVFDAGEGA